MISNMPLRIAVTGVTGRMGKKIIQCIENQKNNQFYKKVVLGAAIVKYRSKICGMDIRSINPSIPKKIMITDNIQLVKDDFDVLIDFTKPEATIEYLNFCVMYQKNMIIGTTGFNENHLSLIKDASQKIGIVYSANFSIGIITMLKLLLETSKSIGIFYDIDIIEKHHNKKNDVPSGTSLMMRDLIKNHLSLYKKKNDLYNSLFPNRLSSESLSKFKHDIKIHSIRSGDIIGEHTVLFSGFGEYLEITHRAFDRSIFANGALYAAFWLGEKKIGLFGLNDVLDLDLY